MPPEDKTTAAPGTTMMPADFITLARKSIPAFKWFIGAVGIASLAATVLMWGIQIESLALVAAVIFAGGIALLAFSWIARLDRSNTSRLAGLMAWSVALLFIACLTCLFSSAVLDWPWPLKTKISRSIAFRQFVAGGPLEKWISTAQAAREAGAVGPGIPVPVTVANAQAEFEQWWVDTPLAGRKAADRATLFQALSLNIRIHRDVEAESKKKTASIKWSDQAISFFEEVADKHFLTEALMEKAAIYVDLADLAHVNADEFQQIARQGDEIVKRAAERAEGSQKAEVYRVWSRFYYNLARPKSGNLTENWDNNYLLNSYDKIASACRLEGENIKNLSQFTRTTLKVAANPPQNQDPLWTKKIWDAVTALADRWIAIEPNITVMRDRISPLNVIAVATCEAVQREVNEASPELPPARTVELIAKLDDMALPFQRQAIILVVGTPLEERYDYDLYYDLARMLALKVLLLDHIPNGDSDGTFNELLVNMEKAKEGATSKQRDSAISSLDNNECFLRLSASRQAQIRHVWQ